MAASIFPEYLSFKDLLTQSPNRYASEQEQQLLKWSLLLPAQSETEQVEQLKQVLTELIIADIKDKWRLKLAGIVISASDRLIATLRNHYIYETGELNDRQLDHIHNIKSLYLKSISIYEGIIRRKSLSSAKKKQHQSGSNWIPQLTTSSSSSPLPMTLGVAIYKAMQIYQKLLILETVCYQKPSPKLWLAINQLYYLSCQKGVAHVEISSMVSNRHTVNIHQLYCQVCLHSLLNLRAMPRANIVMVQRLIPLWSQYIVATIEPKAEMRIFVDLDSDKPPHYLNARSPINPYEAHYHCVFIELAPLTDYLHSYRKVLADEGSETAERCLINKVWMMLMYRYIKPQLAAPNKYSIKKQATLITGFSAIHYRVSDSQSLMDSLTIEELPEAQRPRYDTLPKDSISDNAITVAAIQYKEMSSRFRIMELSSTADSIQEVDTEASMPSPSQKVTTANEGQGAIVVHTNLSVENNDSQPINTFSTAPPLLRNLSLFLLCRSDIKTRNDWSIGIVRWLEADSLKPKIEWQVLGHDLTPCAVRLDDKGVRSQHFIPAIIVGADDQLQTVSTLLLPKSHFHTKDRVVLRINNEEQSLCLERNLINTEEFGQYEMMRL